MRPDDRSLRWLMRPLRDAKTRANRIVHEIDGYGGASEKLVAKARQVLSALDGITD